MFEPKGNDRFFWTAPDLESWYIETNKLNDKEWLVKNQLGG
jgi:hypothetical protein